MNEIEIRFENEAVREEFEKRFAHEMPRPFAPLSYAFFGDAADAAENLANELDGVKASRQ